MYLSKAFVERGPFFVLRAPACSGVAVFETGTELLAMALAHVAWLKDEGGLPPEDNLCQQLQSPAEGAEWLVIRVTDRMMRMVRGGRGGGRRR